MGGGVLVPETSTAPTINQSGMTGLAHVGRGSSEGFGGSGMGVGVAVGSGVDVGAGEGVNDGSGVSVAVSEGDGDGNGDDVCVASGTGMDVAVAEGLGTTGVKRPGVAGASPVCVHATRDIHKPTSTKTRTYFIFFSLHNEMGKNE